MRESRFAYNPTLILLVASLNFRQPPEIWEGGVGFVSKEMIQAHLPPPASDIQVCVEPM